MLKYVASAAVAIVSLIGARRVEAQRVNAPAVGTWRVDAQPVLRVSMNDTLDFSVLVGLSRLPDGGLVVASDMKNNIQFLDAAGRFIKSVGRMGKGPGEFEGVRAFMRFGDTLVLLDLQGGGHLFSLNGKYIRSEPSLPNTIRVHGYLRDGRRVAGTLDYSNAVVGDWRQATETLQLYRGAASAKLGAFPSLEVTREQNGRVRSHVYAPRNRVAVFSRGFCAGYSGSVSVTCHDAQGKRISTVTLSGARPVAVSKEDEEAYFTDIYDANPGEPKAKLDAQVRAARERVTFAKSMGVFGDLIAAQDDKLWIGPPSSDDNRPFATNPVPASTTSWRVYNLGGSQAALIALPAGFRLLEAGSDYVAGVAADEDGLEILMVYRVKK